MVGNVGGRVVFAIPLVAHDAQLVGGLIHRDGSIKLAVDVELLLFVVDFFCKLWLVHDVISPEAPDHLLGWNPLAQASKAPKAGVGFATDDI